MLEKIEHHLEALGIEYQKGYINEQLAIVTKYGFRTVFFRIVIVPMILKYIEGGRNKKWIFAKCKLCDVEDFTEKEKLDLYKAALEIQYDYPEITYSLNKHDFFIEFDCLPDISLKNFSEEFFSVGDGIEALAALIWDLAPRKREPLMEKISLGHSIETVEDYINVFEERLGMPLEVLKTAHRLAQRLQDENISRYTPRTVAAVVFYFACQKYHIDISELDIGRYAWIKQETLARWYNKFAPILEEPLEFD